MAYNWARVAWTISFAVLAIMAIFVYTEYSNRFRDRYGDIKVQPDATSGVRRVDKPAKKPEGPPPHPGRKSRKYRKRR
jgi:hypothetical protein